MNKKTVAVIDVGTLKSKLHIAEFDIANPHNLKTIYKDKQLTVLGRDLDKTNEMIVKKVTNKTVAALKEFKEKMDSYGVVSYKAVTTEAIRKAKNSTQVLKQIKDQTDISLEVLTQEEEAEIYFRSVSSDFDNKLIATADIGGGSVQVVIGRGEEIYEIHKFKTGTYFLQENFSKTHHPTLEELNNAKKYIKKELSTLVESKYKPEMLVYGSTNIIDFMKAMNIKLYEINKLESKHPFKVNLSDLFGLYEKIVALSYEDRMPMYPQEPYYMWAADKALMNIFQISEYLQVKTIVPSNSNISMGLLFELAKGG